MPYTHIANLVEPDNIPKDGILSRTIHDDDDVKVVLFGFAKGEELSEHTASMPAIMHILHGEARLTLGEDSFEGQPGAWMHMRANLAHSVYAETPVIMLLLMLKV